MRIALGLEYDGFAFCGWQSQTQGCGIQDYLQRSLSEIAGHAVTVTTAARTDTGVHALLQVVHFDTTARRPLSAWKRGVNSLLPPSISVLWAQSVPEDFHARYSARQRHYRYILLNREARAGTQYGKVGWYHAPLSLSDMQIAAACLLGIHDFSAFRSSECQAATPVRHMHEVSIVQHHDYFVFAFSANAFLQHMIRNIVGCLIYAGSGKYPPEKLAEILASRDRTLAAPTFSPHGLYLYGISYDETWELPKAKPGLVFVD